ncbi:MAG: hypothetical protein OHK0039_01300 [Bacteroidia bacterium]
MRFRKYLGENYIREEIRKNDQGETEILPLEIVIIYILGFKLEGVEAPVLRVSRCYHDMITGEVVQANNPFIQRLTHESYTIQIPRLQHHQRNQLEDVLEVFSQDNITDNVQTLHYDKSPRNKLIERMLRRLKKAASDEEIRRKMDAEDALDRILSRELKELSDKLRVSEEMRMTAEQKKAELQRRDEEKTELLAELQRRDAEKARQLADLQRQLDEARQRLQEDE